MARFLFSIISMVTVPEKQEGKGVFNPGDGDSFNGPFSRQQINGYASVTCELTFII